MGARGIPYVRNQPCFIASVEHAGSLPEFVIDNVLGSKVGVNGHFLIAFLASGEKGSLAIEREVAQRRRRCSKPWAVRQL